MRITRKVFLDLAIWMVGFGLCIGVAFPFAITMLGIPRGVALRPGFFLCCLSAGALVGFMNYWLARWVVGGRLKVLSSRMAAVQQSLSATAFARDPSSGAPYDCAIPVDSEDEIGESAQAFNGLVESLATSLGIQAAMRSFSDMLTEQLGIEGLADGALAQFCVHTDAEAGLVLCESDGRLRVAAARGFADPDAVSSDERVRAAVRTGRRELVTMSESLTAKDAGSNHRLTEMLVSPISYDDMTLGVVVLAGPHGFDAGRDGLTDVFVQGLGLGLRNALAHDRLRRLAALDPLTGAYNRRFGLDRLHEEFARALRDAAPLGALMFDVDHFKETNDTHGHLIGDRVLQSVRTIARQSLREGDVLFRYGGDEFGCVLPAATRADVGIIAERLRAAVEACATPDGDGAQVRVTVSVGAAAYGESHVARADDLLRLADEALYRAKDAGRNRVEVSA